MEYCAFLLMSSLPATWIVVGCLLLILLLIVVVLYMLKSREVSTLKKQVDELRDTMRMMRYEEANLARMLHTANKPKEMPVEQPEALAEEETEQLVQEKPEELTEAYTEESANVPAVELTEDLAEDLAEDTTPTESLTKEVAPIEETQEESLETETAMAATEDMAEENQAEENQTEENQIEESVTEAQTIGETLEEIIEEAASATSVVETIEEEEETADTISEEFLAPVAEEEEPLALVEESIEIAVANEVEETEAEEKDVENDEEGVENMEIEEVQPTLSPNQKHPINERRPAIPTDLFAAWFAEYEVEPADESPVEEELEKAEASSVVETPAAAATETARPEVATIAPVEQAEQEAITEENTSEDTTESSAEAPEMNKEDERFCRKLERIVTTRLRNPNLNIDIIAAQFGIGRTNFYRKVRELTGMSPNDYLRKCRMERAAELLCNSTEPVSEVCAQVGIPDAQYFSRVFKTFYGVTPSAYRENNK